MSKVSSCAMGMGGKEERAPKGHFVVYVGEEHKRFVVPTSYLKKSIFKRLLDKAAEEFGFCGNRGIVLPCDESTFQRVIDSIHFSKAK